MLSPAILLLITADADPPSGKGWPLGLPPGCKADGQAITVCGRRSDSLRYRLKADPQYEIDHPVEHGWGALSRDMDDVTATGLPNGNSAVGSAGQTGQRGLMVRDYKRWKDARAGGR